MQIIFNMNTSRVYEADLINVDRFNTYVKTVVRGEPVPPFSMDLTRDMGKEKQRKTKSCGVG